MILYIYIFSFLVLGIEGNFHKRCRETLEIGKHNILSVSHKLAESEKRRLHSKINTIKQEILDAKVDVTTSDDILKLMIVRDDQPPCPAPNKTMFTTHAPPVTFAPTTQTTQAAGMTTSEGSSAGNTGTTASGLASTSTATATTVNSQTTTAFTTPAPSEEKVKFAQLYHEVYEHDPFAQHMETLWYYMNREDEVCNTTLIDLNSLTEDQVFGFFASLAAAVPGPFCSLCDRFLFELEPKLFKISSLLNDDHKFMSRLLFAHLPPAKSICSAIAPGCHEDYYRKLHNLTDSVICLECTACMSVTNVIQHRFLLQPTVVDSFLAFLKSSLFHNLCSELCNIYWNQTLSIFPNGFTYEGCQNWMAKEYYHVIKVATTITRPERLCSLELKWCELNEAPNVIHCLKEMCEEYFNPASPQSTWLCNQIPDSPTQANAYLNIEATKQYKQPQSRHDRYEELRFAEFRLKEEL